MDDRQGTGRPFGSGHDTNQEVPWQLEAGYDPREGLAQTSWTRGEWHDWLERLTPRLLVLHLQRWALLAQMTPQLSEELYRGIRDIRAELRTRECQPQR